MDKREFYITAKEAKNPTYDRRLQCGGERIASIPAGTLIMAVMDESEGVASVYMLNVWGDEKHIGYPQGPRNSGNGNALASAVLEACRPLTDSEARDARVLTNRHNGRPDYLDILQRLIAVGAVTPEAVEAAAMAAEGNPV